MWLGGGASPASRVAGAVRVLGIDSSAHANSNCPLRQGLEKKALAYLLTLTGFDMLTLVVQIH